MALPPLGTLGTRRGHGTFRQGGDADDAQVGVGDREGTNVLAQVGHGGQLEGDLVLVEDLQESHLEKRDMGVTPRLGCRCHPPLGTRDSGESPRKAGTAPGEGELYPKHSPA